MSTTENSIVYCLLFECEMSSPSIPSTSLTFLKAVKTKRTSPKSAANRMIHQIVSSFDCLSFKNWFSSVVPEKSRGTVVKNDEL